MRALTQECVYAFQGNFVCRFGVLNDTVLVSAALLNLCY